jgi:hypothetical protein
VRIIVGSRNIVSEIPPSQNASQLKIHPANRRWS